MPEKAPTPRASLLAAELSSLTASRSMVQSEVLTRISIYLTLVSAGLVSLALIGNATMFDNTFEQFAIVVLSIEVIVGALTHVRVVNASMEDLAFVLAMNRIRGAFVDLDPGLEPYLMTSVADDLPGTVRTYYFLGKRGSASQVGGSTVILISVVTGALLGLLLAVIASATGASIGFSITVGIVVGVAWIVAAGVRAARLYAAVWRTHRPVRTTPDE